MSDNQPSGSPAPQQNFEPAVELLQEAPEEDARSGLDPTVHEDDVRGDVRTADGAQGTAVRRPPVVPEDEVPRNTLAERWREHMAASRQQGA
ncbi:MAG TPA: hypothetical protein VK545_16200 [Streptomyces sp.]|nr:hypothetical protein [Streptomyces sp.]